MSLKLLALAVVGLLALYGIYAYVSIRGILKGGIEEAVELKDVDCVGYEFSLKYILLNLDLKVDYKPSFSVILKSLDVDIFVEGVPVGWANLTKEVRLSRGVVQLPMNATFRVASIPYLLFELANSSFKPQVRVLGGAIIYHSIFGNLNVDVNYTKNLDLTDLEVVDLPRSPLSLDNVTINRIVVTDFSVSGSDLVMEAYLNYSGAEELFGEVEAQLGPIGLAELEIENCSGRAVVGAPVLASALLDLLDDGRITVHLTGALVVDGDARHIDEEWVYAPGKGWLCEIVESLSLMMAEALQSGGSECLLTPRSICNSSLGLPLPALSSSPPGSWDP